MHPKLALWRFLFVVGLPLVLCAVEGFSAEKRSLAERLGYKSTDKILIINGDDTGMCHAANLATIESLEKGLMRSATIMVPCPWLPEIAAYAKLNPEKDFGILSRRGATPARMPALDGGFKIAMERGVYAASTWKNERFPISHVSMNFDREAA